MVTATTRVAASGNAAVANYFINVVTRWAGRTLTCIIDGDHIVLFDHATLVRALDVDLTRKYQPATPDRPQGRNNRRAH